MLGEIVDTSYIYHRNKDLIFYCFIYIILYIIYIIIIFIIYNNNNNNLI